jgi:hypothetical protein
MARRRGGFLATTTDYIPEIPLAVAITAEHRRTG